MYQTKVQSLSKLSTFLSTTEPQFHIHRLAKTLQPVTVRVRVLWDLCHVPRAIPENVLWCGRVYCPARGAAAIS